MEHQWWRGQGPGWLEGDGEDDGDGEDYQGDKVEGAGEDDEVDAHGTGDTV